MNLANFSYFVITCLVILDLIFAALLPNNYEKIALYFYLLMYVEQIFLGSKRGMYNMKESLTSMNHGVLHESVRLLTHHWQEFAYLYIYESTGYRMFTSDLNEEEFSWIRCCIGFIVTDFCYYWVHRLKHEVHFLWIFHQVHHSSELYELPVGVQHSAVEVFYDFIFYIPLVVFLNPYYVMFSRELIYVYQLFIHTELINRLGWFELVLNTPNHHRIHHGGNKYCLDKNYGGVLIIWDRMFGTFQEKDRYRKTFYGLPISPKYYHTIYQQFNGITNLFRQHAHLLRNKKYLFPVFFNGPRWTLNTPRLGLDTYKRARQPKNDKDHAVESYWQFHYVCHAHYILALNALELYAVKDMNFMRIIHALQNMFFSFCGFAFFYDKYKAAGIILNFLRSCYLYFVYYDFPKWCIHVYSIVFIYDGLYLLILLLDGVILLLREKDRG